MKIYIFLFVLCYNILLNQAQRVNVSIGTQSYSYTTNTSVRVQVSETDISFDCITENFSQWLKNGVQVNNFSEPFLFIPVMTFSMGGNYSCYDSTMNSLTINLIPIGAGVFYYNGQLNVKLNNDSEIVGPYITTSKLFCASSVQDLQTSWRSSFDNFVGSLQFDKVNLTLASIDLHGYIITTDFEAVYQCIGMNENSSIVNYFIRVYLLLPIHFSLISNGSQDNFERNLISGTVAFFPIDLHSDLKMFCDVDPAEILTPNNIKLISNISRFDYSNIGRYTCRRENSNRALVRVDVLVKVIVYLFAPSQISPICSDSDGDCILPVATKGIQISCNTSSSNFSWINPPSLPNGDQILIPILQNVYTGVYTCVDSINSLLPAANFRLFTSGFKLRILTEFYSRFFSENDVFISNSSSVLITCFVGTIEDFEDFDLNKDNGSFPIASPLRDLFNKTIEISVNNFTENVIGNYTCGRKSSNGDSISILLYNYQSVFPQIILFYNDLPILSNRSVINIIQNTSYAFLACDALNLLSNAPISVKLYHPNGSILTSSPPTVYNISNIICNGNFTFSCLSTSISLSDYREISVNIIQVPISPHFSNVYSNSTSIFIEWTSVNNPCQIDFYLTLELFHLNLTFHRVNLSSNTFSFEFNSLSVFSTYTICIASSTYFWVEKMRCVQVRTAGSAPSAPPSNIQILTIDSNFIFLSWTKISETNSNSFSLEYIIHYKPSYAPDFVNISRIRSCSYFLTSLTAFTSYEIRISALNRFGHGPLSLPVYSTTNGIVPTIPTEVHFFLDIDNNLFLTWKPPYIFGGIIHHYRFLLTVSNVDEEAFRNISLIVDPSTFNITIPQVIYGSRICFSIGAINQFGDGPLFSKCFASLTKLPCSPSNLKITNLDGFKLQFSWNISSSKNGPILQQKIYIYKIFRDYLIGILSNFLGNSTNSHLIFSDPFSNYLIRISSFTTAGEGIYAEANFLQNKRILSPFIDLELVRSYNTYKILWSLNHNLDFIWETFSIVILGLKNYSNDLSVQRLQISLTPETSEINLKNLVASTDYLFSIVSKNSLLESEQSHLSFETFEEDLIINTPQVLFSEFEREIIFSLTETSYRNAEIIYHLLIVVIFNNDFDHKNLDISDFHNISNFQFPDVVEDFYAFVLYNISSSCPFPSILSSKIHFESCLTKNDSFIILSGYNYIFYLRGVTRQMKFHDSLPSEFIRVPSNLGSSGISLDIFYSILAILFFMQILSCFIFIIITCLLLYRLVCRSYSTFVLFNDESNHFGNISQDTFDPPSLNTSFTQLHQLKVLIGSNLEIPRPKVSGTKPFNYLWVKNDLDIDNDSSILILQNLNLYISNVQEKHVGVYLCIVDNLFGQIKVPFSVQVVTRDDFVTNANENLDTSALIHLPTDKLAVEFGQHVQALHQKNNQGFKNQYIDLKDYSFEMNYSISKEIENKSKNRYSNIFPYNHSRVILAPLAGYIECSHDYINASLIQGYNDEFQYIAAQGPMDSTIIDMWRLIWQFKLQVVVMLTKLNEGDKIKCSCYWPDDDSYLSLGPFKVISLSTFTASSYIHRIFSLQNALENDDSLTINHFQFIAWPDFGVPEISLVLNFHETVSSYYLSMTKQRPPLLLHCSAGVGRTGTFIVIDAMLQKIGVENKINIFGYINEMRKSRSKMIQTLDQYIFCHDAILVAYMCRKSNCVYTLSTRKDFRDYCILLNQVSRHSNYFNFQQEYQALEFISVHPEDAPCLFAKSNIEKNRNPLFLPPDYSGVSLSSTRGYINAVFINSNHQKGAFIIAQTPIDSTKNDFWTMISDYQITSIVMLCSPKEVDYVYWPEIGETDVFNNFTVHSKLAEDICFGVHHIFQLNFTNTQKDSFDVDHYMYLNFDHNEIPKDYDDFAKFVFNILQLRKVKGNDRILVHCCDSVGKSSLFVVACLSFERVLVDDNIDIFQASKDVRFYKPGSIRNEIHYCSLYKICETFLNIN